MSFTCDPRRSWPRHRDRVYPGHSGIIANDDYRPGTDLQKPVAMQALGVIRKGYVATELSLAGFDAKRAELGRVEG